MLFRDYMSTVSDDDCVQCIGDHLILERDGMIGECALRRVARGYTTALGDTPTVMWMEQVATSCYRRFAMRYLGNDT